MITASIAVASPSHSLDFDNIEDSSVLDGTTKITGPTAVENSTHSQEFDDKENYAPIVPVQDDVAIYSPQDHQKLEDIQSHFSQRFPQSKAHYYANPQALKKLVLAMKLRVEDSMSPSKDPQLFVVNTTLPVAERKLWT